MCHQMRLSPWNGRHNQRPCPGKLLLHAQVGALRADLSTAEAARARLRARCQRLEEETLQQRLQPPASSCKPSEEGDEAEAEAEVLVLEVQRLRGEKAAAREECRRLRQQAAQDAAEIEHLTKRLQQLTGSGQGPSRGCSSVRARQAAAAADCPAAPAQHSVPIRSCTSQVQQPEQGHQQGHEAQQPGGEGGIGSPIEEPASETTPAAASAAPQPAVRSGGSAPRSRSRPGSSPGTARPRRQAARNCTTPTKAPAAEAAGPSLEERRQFRHELQHTLCNAERPGVVSRFPHSLGSFLALRPDLEVWGPREGGEEAVLCREAPRVMQPIMHASRTA